jgi:hypothetical protein
VKGIRCYINCCLRGSKVDENVTKDDDAESSSEVLTSS